MENMDMCCESTKKKRVSLKTEKKDIWHKEWEIKWENFYASFLVFILLFFCFEHFFYDFKIMN